MSKSSFTQTARQKAMFSALKRMFKVRYPPAGVAWAEDFDLDAWTARRERLERLLRKGTDHLSFQHQQQKRWRYAAKIDRMKARAGQAIAMNETLLAIDVEGVRSGRLHEIGLAIYKDGVITSRNLRVPGAKSRVEFEFGETEIMPINKIAMTLRLLVEKSQFLVGHSLVSDFHALKEMGITIAERPFFDTAEWAQRGWTQAPKLGDLCAELGVPARVPHCGGNDARYSLEALLKMATPYVAEEAGL